jgi:hypothetical protein
MNEENDEHFLHDCLDHTQEAGQAIGTAAGAVAAGGVIGTAVGEAAAGAGVPAAAPVLIPDAIVTGLTSAAAYHGAYDVAEPRGENLWSDVCVVSNDAAHEINNLEHQLNDIIDPPSPPFVSPDLAFNSNNNSVTENAPESHQNVPAFAFMDFSPSPDLSTSTIDASASSSSHDSSSMGSHDSSSSISHDSGGNSMDSSV